MSVAAGTRAEGMSVNDVTPTLLAWFGLPSADDMAGKVPSFASFAAIGSVSTYETTVIERLAEGDRSLDDALIEQLRSLGYVE